MGSAEEIVTKTVVVRAGRFAASEYEHSLTSYANDQGLACTVQRSRGGLLSIEMAFTVTGPRRQVRLFEKSVPQSGPGPGAGFGTYGA